MLNTNQILDLDLSSPAFIANPYPAYQTLRNLDSPYWVPFQGKSHSHNSKDGMWLFAKFHQAEYIFQDHHHTSTDIDSHLSGKVSTAFGQTMLQLDPPTHTRLRKLVSNFFKLNNIKRMEAHIVELVDDCLCTASAGDGFDFMNEFAKPLPVKVIARILGIPENDAPLLSEWSSKIVEGLDYVISDEQQRKLQHQAMYDMHCYFTDWLKNPDHLPQDTISYELHQAHINSNQLTKTEMISMLMLLFSAGHGNISNALGNGMMALLQHPEQKFKLINNPQLIDSAVEEMLRYESPLQRSVMRVVTDELEIDGKIYGKGENLSMILGSANRDVAQFENPEIFSITRNSKRNLAFGAGIHACFGAHLSRMQMRITYNRILKQQPDISLANGTIQWRPLTMIRELKTLPVLF